MKKSLLFFASALVFVCSCSQEINSPADNQEQQETVVPEGYTLYTLHSDCTKLSIDGDTPKWSKGDKMKFIDADGSQYTSDALSEEYDGQTEATFYFQVPLDREITPLYGVYPSNLTAVVNDGKLNVTFPGETQATASNHALMCGEINKEEATISFRNIAHLIRFETENTQMGRIQFCELNEKAITGQVAVSFDKGEITVTPVQEGARQSIYSKINGAGTYYIPVLPSSEPWAGIAFRYATGRSGAWSYSTGFIGKKAITPTRNRITNLGNIDGLFETEIDVTSAEQLSEILNTENKASKIWYLNGKTLKLAAGTYDFGGAEIKNTPVGEGIKFTLQGADKAATIIDCKSAKRFFKVVEGTNNKPNDFTFENLTIKNGYDSGSEGGGAVYINGAKGKFNFRNCVFDNCVSEGGQGGGIHFVCKQESDSMTLTDCEFKNCEGCHNKPYTTTNSLAAGGAISTKTGTLDIENCVFDGNMGASGAVINIQGQGSNVYGIVRINNSEFKNNKLASRGVIQVNTGGVLFLNNCKFHDNTMITGQWGMIIHGGEKSVVCLNNCTIHGNTEGASGSYCLNSDGLTTVTNSTIINGNGSALVRNTSKNVSGLQVLFDNNILINTATNGKVMNDVKVSIVWAYNNYLGNNANLGDGWTKSGNKEGVTSLDGGNYDPTTGAYLWNGPADDFTMTTPAKVEQHLRAITYTNGNTALGGAYGPKFAHWVKSKGGFENDMLGNPRTEAGTWPGAVEGGVK